MLSTFLTRVGSAIISLASNMKLLKYKENVAHMNIEKKRT